MVFVGNNLSLCNHAPAVQKIVLDNSLQDDSTKHEGRNDPKAEIGEIPSHANQSDDDNSTSRAAEAGDSDHGTFVPLVIKLDRDILHAVPTPESAEAFAKLVEAREKLTEVTRQLNEAHAKGLIPENRQRYLDLQKEWDEAFKRFETATDEFSALVRKLPEMVVTHRLPKPENSDRG